tara:strand:- start:108 stop:1295 length:1188 start_codon:yes stop_codon:yes gene_type:complete
MSRTKVRGTVIIDNPAFGGIGAIQVPVGTTTERDAGFGMDGVAPSTVFSKGMLRYNSTDDQFEGYDGAQWAQIAGGGGGGSTAMAVQKYNGDNTTVTFNLVPTDPNVPLASASTLMVDINGLMQDEGTGKAFTINLVTNPQTLTFSEAPVTGDVITIRHLGEISNSVSTVNSSAFGSGFGGTIDTVNDKILMLDASANTVYSINIGTIAGDPVPAQSGQNGKFLTTDGTSLSWVTVTHPTELPAQTSQTGKFLTTDGTNVSWAVVDALPSQSGQADKFLKTDGTTASWNTVTASPNEGSYIIINAAHSAVLGTRLLCDTTTVAFTITLPTAGLIAGEAISITDGVGNCATNNVTVNGGTNNIVSTAGTSGTTLLIDDDGAVVTLVWSGTSWRAIV